MTPTLPLNVLKLGRLLIGCASNMTQPGRTPPADGKKAVDVLERRILEECRKGEKANHPLSEAILFVEKVSDNDGYMEMVRQRLRCIAILAAAELLSEGPGVWSTASISRAMAWNGDGDSTERQMACRAVTATLLEDGILRLSANPSQWDRLSLCEDILQWIGTDAYISHTRMCRLASGSNKDDSGGQQRPVVALPLCSGLRDAICEHVVGLEAQSSISIVASTLVLHLSRVRMIQAGHDLGGMGSEAVIVAGSSGTGKSFLLNTAARIVGLPFSHADASNMSSEPYVGGRCTDPYRDLIMKTGDARTAQSPCVIIYDEWDKKAAGHGDLASTTGVQNEMLMLLQGQGGSQTVGGRRWGDLPPTPIDSRFSCFFFAGVYEGLADILKKQVGATSLGFGGSGNRNRDANVRSALHEYGYTAEFLNRISAVIAIPDPGIATLMAIATKPTTGIVAVHARLLSDSGLGFRIDDRALRLIAARSMEERTFARGMKNAVALLAQHVVVSGRSTTFTARDVQSVLDDADKATVGILTGKPLPVTKRKQARRQAPLVWADGSVMEDAHA